MRQNRLTIAQRFNAGEMMFEVRAATKERRLQLQLLSSLAGVFKRKCDACPVLKRWTVFTAVSVYIVLFFTPGMSLFAVGEHPEHPRQQFQLPQQGTQSQTSTAQAQQVSKADISAGIKKHIAITTKKSSDKKFHVKHQGKDLVLDLVKVHDDRLSNLGGGKYFACVDMKAADGTIYDIDFFLNGNPGNMKVTETSVHKINGKPLYNWKEQGGVWRKVST
jgi:hypothetical protein